MAKCRRWQIRFPASIVYSIVVQCRQRKTSKTWTNNAKKHPKKETIQIVYIKFKIPTHGKTHKISQYISRMHSEGSRFIWGWGCVRGKLCLCPQPSATVRVIAVRLSTVASAFGMIPKACQVDSWSPQLFWRLQRRSVCEWFVAPQLYWYLQRRCLCEWFVSPQLYWYLKRKCQCDWFAAPQLYWCLQRRC